MRLDETGAVARALDIGRRARREGARGTASRVALRLHQALRTEGLEGFLRPGDVAVSDDLRLPDGAVLPAGSPITIGWVCSPAGPGSGGHTTYFRMLRALRDRGHRCVLFLYDASEGDFERKAALMRRDWPMLDVEIRDAARGIDGMDACVAASWETAHVVARRAVGPMHRFYFVQDFEPYFFPRGSHYALAEDTYRFGFHTIALGGAVAQMLKSEVGVSSYVVPFGCDTDVYHLADRDASRSGVVFYARPGAPRRGCLLGLLALEEFHRLHPDQEIHLFGEPVQPPPFPVTHHGKVSPAELNDLYNRTIGGLALSFTNVTLVADEMLAAGNIPVANENPHAHGGLDSEHVVWAHATPEALGRALAAVVEEPDVPGRAEAAARSVTTPWSLSQELLADFIEETVWDRAASGR